MATGAGRTHGCSRPAPRSPPSAKTSRARCILWIIRGACFDWRKNDTETLVCSISREGSPGRSFTGRPADCFGDWGLLGGDHTSVYLGPVEWGAIQTITGSYPAEFFADHLSIFHAQPRDGALRRDRRLW